MYFTALRDMIRGIDADLVPPGICSQPVFKWSSLLSFHFPGSAGNNELFKQQFEPRSWSVKFPDTKVHLTACCFLLGFLCLILQSRHLSSFSHASSNTCHLLSLLNCYFSGKKLNCCLERSEGCVASWQQWGCPFWHELALPSHQVSHTSWMLANAESSPGTSCPRQLLPSPVPLPAMVPLNWNDLIMSLK